MAAVAPPRATNVDHDQGPQPTDPARYHAAEGFAPGPDPRGAADSFAVSWPRSPSAARRHTRRWNRRKARVGVVANKNGLTAQQLAMFNPKIKRPEEWQPGPGQVVLVPTAAVAAAATNAARTRRSSATRSPRTRVLHVVKSGETLGVAWRRGTTRRLSRSMKMNGLQAGRSSFRVSRSSSLAVVPYTEGLGEEVGVAGSGEIIIGERDVGQHARAEEGSPEVILTLHSTRRGKRKRLVFPRENEPS